MNILITGGAGFVGSSLAKLFKKQYANANVIAFDNLKRRGSELNLDDFKKLDIKFVHGDIREIEDLNSLNGNFDVLIEASAEPSVHAGNDGNTAYVWQSNLLGTINCLEFAKKKCKNMIFLSTSRVYSIENLIHIPLVEERTRFSLDHGKIKEVAGLSEEGISESFDCSNFRSLYGATKLCSEYIIQEYCGMFNMNIVVDRCGVIAGPGQWGKIDQGVFTLWVANHFLQKPLNFIGFGGKGKQVRDLLHPHDLFALIVAQLEIAEKHRGEVFNIGGGIGTSVSLLELTKICEEITTNSLNIGEIPETNNVDIPYYVTDFEKANATFSWSPQYNVSDIVWDIYNWIKNNDRITSYFKYN